VNEPPKLPQARMYLQSAQWGFDELLRNNSAAVPFRFYLIGILASLRTVQHALMNHDSTLSGEHKRVIEDWRQATPLSTPELHFIRTSREIRRAIDWCDRELTAIEAKVPPAYDPRPE
jgi:hypothetical protein